MRALRALRWVAVAIATIVLLAVAAYKHWIPGGDLVGDYVDLARSKMRVLGFRREAASVPPGSVVFLGSSSIEAFPLDASYPGAPWINRGVAAEIVPEMIERLDASLPVARPAGVVIHTGQNDLRARALPPEVIVESIGRAADAVRARFPDVPITLVELMPLCDAPESSIQRLNELNEGLRVLAEARGFGFVRADRPPLTDGRGRLLVEMAGPDRKHMHLAGYQILARWIALEGGAATEPLRAAWK